MAHGSGHSSDHRGTKFHVSKISPRARVDRREVQVVKIESNIGADRAKHFFFTMQHLPPIHILTCIVVFLPWL